MSWLGDDELERLDEALARGSAGRASHDDVATVVLWAERIRLHTFLLSQVLSGGFDVHVRDGEVAMSIAAPPEANQNYRDHTL